MKTLFIVLIGLSATLCYAADDIESLAASCAVCHGAQGISSNPAWPNLAGQKRGYLAAQIKAFRDAQRNNPLMSAVVRNLDDKQINRLARFYADLDMPKNYAPKKNTTELSEAGRHVRAYCISCHGKRGITVNEEWPNLAGQQKEYLRQQLLDYRSGRRTGLPMSVIARELNESQIEAVAQYYSQITYSQPKENMD